MFGLKFIGINEFAQGLNPIVVGCLVCAIGISLGGTTGYAINPARDLAPRFLYSLMRGKKANSDWSYSWIPVVAPIIGSFIAALLYNLLGIVN